VLLCKAFFERTTDPRLVVDMANNWIIDVCARVPEVSIVDIQFIPQPQGEGYAAFVYYRYSFVLEDEKNVPA